MLMTGCEEWGPDTAATRARSRGVQRIAGGEGWWVEVGADADTHWVYFDSGTTLDFLAPDDVSEHDWHHASSLRRFASCEERDAWIRRQDWWHRGGEPERPIEGAASEPPGRSFAFSLELGAGLTGTRVQVRSSDEPYGLRYDAESLELSAASLDTGARVDEWARFSSELGLLGAWDWHQYGTQAVDGLGWSLRAADHSRHLDAGGYNAYPPDGYGTPTAEFGRLLLAVERVLGRPVWPAWDFGDALDAIPDERDRVEHLILAAARAWAHQTRDAGPDVGELRETQFQAQLRPHLERLVPCLSEQAPNLRDWSPGKVDLVLDADTAPVWIELKWCKNSDTFGNCLWDAGKLAAAVREGRARQGYLLVGAPLSVWREPGPHALVTRVSSHPGERLVTDHATWWRHWQKENTRTYPRRLPTPVITVPVGRVRHFGSPEPWELWLTRVEAPGDDAYDPVAAIPSIDIA